jgi:hypothetical protein
MEKLIEVKYQFKEYQNSVLRKFFKSQEQVNLFKEQHPDYIYLN